ncbi:MAG: hypothetical protein JWN48_2580 [Myxococcaceae bacterium]|nr:hypothetical protein [Myxococcaceae bacterium]
MRGLTVRLALSLWLPLLGLTCSSGAMAQGQPAEQVDLLPGGPGTEPVDATRRDVQQLPPEALQVTRDMYARGLFLEAQLGGSTFAGDARKVSHAGPRLAIALGYELTRWVSLLLQVEGSMHQTDNRPPPAHTAYQLVGSVVGVRFSLPLDARFAIWAAGLIGLAWANGDVMHALGFKDADRVGLNYGGELGFDWHMRSRHHSLGLLAGARQLPALQRDGFTVAPYAAAYLRYVF